MPPTVTQSLAPMFAIFGVVLIVLTALFALSVRRWRADPSRGRLVTSVAAGLAVAVVASVIGYGVYAGYVRENSWTFSYSISVAGTVFPDALIVPSVVDERLLAGLVLASGTANWSFVDTIHGRGLYVAFRSNATLSANLAQFPPPVPFPNANLTMANGTGSWSNVWIWRQGSAALSLYFSENYRSLWPNEIQPGWHVYQLAAAPMAT